MPKVGDTRLRSKATLLPVSKKLTGTAWSDRNAVTSSVTVPVNRERVGILLSSISADVVIGDINVAMAMMIKANRRRHHLLGRISIEGLNLVLILVIVHLLISSRRAGASSCCSSNSESDRPSVNKISI